MENFSSQDENGETVIPLAASRNTRVKECLRAFKPDCSFLLGIFDESDLAGILDSSNLKSITEEEKLKWVKKYNVTVEQYLKDSMVNYVGKSLSDFLRLV